MPSTLKRNDVRFCTSGPRKPAVKRRNCSGVFACANALRAFKHVVAQAEVCVAAPLREAGTRNDLHHHASRIVIVGREGVGPESYLPDFVTIRKTAAAKAIHLKDRTGAARHRLQLLAQFVRVVRQLRDLVFFEGGRQRIATWVGVDSLADHDFFLKAGDAQCDGLVIVAATQRHACFVRREPG